MTKNTMKTATLIPNPGFRGLYSLLSKLRCLDNPEPEARAVGLRLTWVGSPLREGEAVSVGRDDPAEPACAHIQDNGSLVMAKLCTLIEVLALRNLAAKPKRRFRRSGFERQECPFCSIFLEYHTLESGLGHCLRCGELIGWPLNQLTAARAEDELREDIMREIEEEDREG